MKSLTIRGDLDVAVLSKELTAVLGDPGSPQKWYFNGELSAITVYYDESILDATVQGVFSAHLAAASTRATNAPIDQQIVALETKNPFTPRSFREAFLLGATESPATNAVIASIESKLNEIIAYLKVKDVLCVIAAANVGRVVDATQTAGMKKLAQLDAAITSLRNTRV